MSSHPIVPYKAAPHSLGDERIDQRLQDKDRIISALTNDLGRQEEKVERLQALLDGKGITALLAKHADEKKAYRLAVEETASKVAKVGTGLTTIALFRSAWVGSNHSLLLAVGIGIATYWVHSMIQELLECNVPAQEALPKKATSPDRASYPLLY